MALAADMQQLTNTITQKAVLIEKLQQELHKVIVGQQYMIERLLIGLLSNGHVLLEGVPGLAKTLTIKSLAQAIDAKFSRIQFTPDLLPADVVGTMIYQQHAGEFAVRKGPVFANFVLADEINRAPAKVQSALLEAMQEKQVTIGSNSYPLPVPFLVLATQNPIEQEGTYPLPEAQVDRFMLKVVVGYPSKEEELAILLQQTAAGKPATIQPVLSIIEIIEARELVKQVYVDEKIFKYIIDIVFATRFPSQYGLHQLASVIGFGASPRASISLAQAAKAHAFLQKRAYVIPDDVKAIALDVLRHRIGLTYEAQAENMQADDVVQLILKNVKVP